MGKQRRWLHRRKLPMLFSVNRGVLNVAWCPRIAAIVIGRSREMQPPTIAPSKLCWAKNECLQRSPSRSRVMQDTPLVPDSEIYRGCGGLNFMNPVILPPPVKSPGTARVRFKNILFATDLAAASAPAQAYPVPLARMFGSHLFAVHAETGPGLTPRYEKALTRVAHKSEATAVTELAEFFHTAKVPFTLLVERGELTEVLNRVVDEHAIDLVILGTRGRKGLSHLLSGSMSETVSRSSTCPVITVGPRARTGFESALKTILYATDFSDESRAALPYAVSLAQEFNARLVVTHVAPERLVHDRAHVEGYLMNRLKDLAPPVRYRWCTLDHIVSFGDPARQILKTAKDEDADLMRLGLHTSVQFTSRFPERLAYSIVGDAPCPVMSVLPTLREMKLARAPAVFLAMAANTN